MCVRVNGQVRGRFTRRVGVRALRTALAVDPAGIAVDVVLFLPDRDAMLDLVDDVTARGERFRAMRGAHADPDGEFADREIADAVHASRAPYAEPRDRLRDDAFAFAHRQRRERFVLQTSHALAFVVVAHPSFEARVAAARRVAQFRAIRVGRERRLAETERGHQPPATGGMNTTRSPGCSGADHSQNSSFTATRSIERGNVKPMGRADFVVEVGRRRAPRLAHFLAEARLFAEHGEVLDADAGHRGPSPGPAADLCRCGRGGDLIAAGIFRWGG